MPRPCAPRHDLSPKVCRWCYWCVTSEPKGSEFRARWGEAEPGPLNETARAEIEAAWGRPEILVPDPRRVLVRVPDPELPPRRSLRAVVSCAAGSEGEDLWKLSGPWISAYARRLGADLVVLRDPSNAVGNHAKLTLGKVFRGGWETLVFLDADTIADPLTVGDLFAETPAGYVGIYNELPGLKARGTLGGFEEEYQLCRESQGLSRKPLEWYGNTGVIVVPRAAADLFDVPTLPYPLKHCGEQHYWVARLVDSGFLVHFLPRKYNSQWWEINNLLAEPPDTILHFSGLRPHRPNAVRLDLMRRALGRTRSAEPARPARGRPLGPRALSLYDKAFACVYRREPTGRTVACGECGGKGLSLPVLKCDKYGECTERRSEEKDLNWCRGCLTRVAPTVVESNRPTTPLPPKPPTLTPLLTPIQPAATPAIPAPSLPPRRNAAGKPLKWAYGITTVPSRRNDLFPRTLASLVLAGFPEPRLFVDGTKDAGLYEGLGLEVTTRWPTVRTYANWILSLWELYAREPNADHYALFQDDFVTYRHLRDYLERTPYPEKGYLNLYTFPSNQSLCPKDERGAEKVGWYVSNQFGRGAVALVFDREATIALLSSRYMVERPLDAVRGHKAVDGGIVIAMKQLGYREFVHNPSLVQHTGLVSSMGNRPHKLAESFRGESYDARELLPCSVRSSVAR